MESQGFIIWPVAIQKLYLFVGVLYLGNLHTQDAQSMIKEENLNKKTAIDNNTRECLTVCMCHQFKNVFQMT